MIKGIFHAAAGMLPRMNQQETIGNNLANVNTTGFKADHRYFRTELNSNLLQGGPGGGPLQLTDEQFSLITDFTQGTLVETHNPLDVAIHGDGFFVLETGDAQSYTRNGSFAVNTDGELVNNRGFRVMGETGAVRIAGRQIQIHSNGDIIVDGASAGKLKMVDFEQPYQLKRNGYGYFTLENAEEGFTPEDAEFKPGFLENSNVDPISEMIEMIELNRNYESCQKAIVAQDETLRLAVNEVGR